jgi:hypothetical protein
MYEFLKMSVLSHPIGHFIIVICSTKAEEMTILGFYHPNKRPRVKRQASSINVAM